MNLALPKPWDQAIQINTIHLAWRPGKHKSLVINLFKILKSYNVYYISLKNEGLCSIWRGEVAW